MLSFDTTTPFSFEVDGKAYTIPQPRFADVEELAAFGEADGDARLAVVRGIFEKRADKRTMTAINSLGFRQVGELFKAWAGGSVGESQPSAG